MANFILIVDEFGDLNTDKSSEPYGYGFLLAEQGPTLTAVERMIASTFPAVFHLKTYSGQQNKLAKAREMLSLLPGAGHFYGGGLIQTDPAYGRTKLYDTISGHSENSPVSSGAMIDLLNAAPLNPGELAVPGKVVSELLKVTRLVSVYSAVLRLPLIALLKAVDRPEDVVLDVQLGTVGPKSSYEARIRKISKHLTRTLQQSLATFVKEGVITTIPKQINIKTTTGREPLFGVADLFAGITFHYHRYTVYENHKIGEQLYTAAKPILERLPWQPSQKILAKGIIKL